MLKKRNRLTRAEFDKVFKANKSFHSKHLTLLVADSSVVFDTKYAVVVSKKVLPRRVDRRKLRRMLYCMFKTVIIARGYKAPAAILMIKKQYRADNIDMTDADFVAECQSLFSNLTSSRLQ